MVQIHPAVSEIWVPQSLAQVLPDLTSFWTMGKPIWAYGQITMTLHKSRSRQVHEVLNGVNPVVSDIRVSQSLDPICGKVIFGPYGANGEMIMTVHKYRHRQFHRTPKGENPSSSYRNMGSANLAATHPPGPWRQYPSSGSPEGWGVKSNKIIKSFKKKTKQYWFENLEVKLVQSFKHPLKPHGPSFNLTMSSMDPLYWPQPDLYPAPSV